VLVILAAATLASTPAPQVFVARRAAVMADVACKPSGRYEIADPALLYRYDGKAQLKALGDMPRANHEKAVLRTVGPCSVPVVVRYGAGR